MRATFCTVVVLATRAAHADPTAPTTITLDEAVAYTDAHHPTRRSDTAAEQAAAADVDAEHARYVPDIELFLQLDRSSSNAAPGALFPVPALPVVGGEPGRVLDLGHWGTAGGATASWDALGFKTWDAAVARARAEVRLAHDEAAADRLDLEFTAIDRFIVELGRAEAVKAAQAGVDRTRVFVSIVKATVSSDLRAGADLSRAEAELAFAQTALVRAEAALDVSRAELAEALGAPALRPALVAGSFAAAPARPGAAAPARDPRLAVADDQTQVARAHRDEIATGTRPRLLLLGALWGRGNGQLAGGAGAAGLVPDVPNWALGAVLTWPVLAGSVIDPQAKAAAARVDRERAREELVAQQLASRTDRASVLLDGAYRVADNTPLALKAAREAEQQITARYKAQLATADDVAQAQRLLVQAETEDALARLDVWRALLFRAYAAGDLAPFLAAYHGGH